MAEPQRDGLQIIAAAERLVVGLSTEFARTVRRHWVREAALSNRGILAAEHRTRWCRPRDHVAGRTWLVEPLGPFWQPLTVAARTCRRALSGGNLSTEGYFPIRSWRFA